MVVEGAEGRPVWVAGWGITRPGLELSGVPDGAAVVVWSGAFWDEDSEGMFAADPRTFFAPGWRQLAGRLAEMGPALERRDLQILIRPHARHVVSDFPAVSKLLREVGPAAGGIGRVGVLFDPISMITGGMRALAEDHLERSCQLFGELAERLGAAAGVGVLVSGVPRAGGAVDGAEFFEPVPVHRSELGVGALVSRFAASGAFGGGLVCLEDVEIDAQMAALATGLGTGLGPLAGAH